MTCCQCEGIEREFDARFARKELKRYRKKGLRKTSRLLVEAIRKELGGASRPDGGAGEADAGTERGAAGGEPGGSLLDIGGGVGGLQHALLEAGLDRAASVDAAPAFVEAAREEAQRRGLDDRIEFISGDFLDVAERVPPADVVTLDRVICCYHDMPALVGASAARAQMLYGVVYPRDEWWTRLGGQATNLFMRIRRSPMRAFVHPTEQVDAILRRQGFRMLSRETTPIWQVVVYGR